MGADLDYSVTVSDGCGSGVMTSTVSVGAGVAVGTSVGALNGALMALDNFDAALDIWENMSMDSVFQNFVNMSDEENPDRESYIKELAKEAIFKGGAD